MSIFKLLCAAIVGLALLLSTAAGFVVSSASAQETGAAANPTSIRMALEQQLGKRAKLVLASGEDVEGKVAEVSDKVVIIQELTGMEFYGATVRLDEVAVVIVRTRSQ